MSESYRIAIADDEQIVVDYLSECLMKTGHEVVAEANSGEQLVALCSATKPELIITDIMMKDQDGLSAVEEILRSQSPAVIFLSAYHGSDFIERANQCHALAYLVKPIREPELVASIPLAMQRSQELALLRKEASDMRRALEDRKVIERAKGIVMRKLELDEAGAFQHLQKLARRHRKRLIDIANSVILAEEVLQIDR